MAILDAVFANKPGQTPQDVERRRRMAAALIESGAGGPPPSSGLELAGRLAMTLSGQYQGGKAERQDATNRSSANKALIDAVFGTNPPPSGAPAQPRAASPYAPQSMPAPSAQASPAGLMAAGNAQPASMPTGETASYVRQGLVQRGLPEHVADAFVMNFQDESGLNPGINEAAPIVPGSRGGYGLYQLTGPRRRAYEAFAQERGVAPDNVDAQLDFMMSELQGPEAKAAQSILAAPDTGTAAAAIVNQFLRPSEEHRARREARYRSAAPDMGPATSGQVANASPMQQPAQAPMAFAPAMQQGAGVPPPPIPAPAQADPRRAELQQMGVSLGSPQLANADPRQGILNALMAEGGGAASPQGQFPQAPAQQQAPMQMAQAGGDNRAMIAELLGNPYTAEAGQQLLMQELGRRQEMADPRYQMEMERAQLELEQLRNPQPKPTDDIREYEYARSQGYEGTYTDFQQDMRRAGASNVSVNTGSEVGTIPPGFELFTDPQSGARSMRPIAGGPAAAEAEQAASAANNRDVKNNRTADVVTQDIDRALSIIDSSTLPTTGAIGEVLSGIGGTSARDLRGLLDTVRANAGFAELQAMRDSSPTGGALGQVTERELAFLQATIGNLEQSQTADQLKDNLNRVYNTYLDIAHGPEGGPERRRLGFESPAGEIPRPADVPQDLWDVMSPEDRALWQ